jgi:hypothetical protein
MRQQTLERDDPFGAIGVVLESAMNRRHPTNAKAFVDRKRPKLLLCGLVDRH